MSNRRISALVGTTDESMACGSMHVGVSREGNIVLAVTDGSTLLGAKFLVPVLDVAQLVEEISSVAREYAEAQVAEAARLLAAVTAPADVHQ